MSAVSASSTPITALNYDIQIATIEDGPNAANFLETYFFPDEPMCRYLGITSDDGPRDKRVREGVLKGIGSGLNLKAVRNGKLMGIALNDIYERGYQEKQKVIELTDERFHKIKEFRNKVSRQADVFSKFPGIDKAFTVKIISVHDAYRRKGIAAALMTRARDIAKKHSCGFMFVECTSHFTAKAVKKLGFDLAYSLDYADYEVNGEVVMKSAPPHKAVTVYTQKL